MARGLAVLAFGLAALLPDGSLGLLAGGACVPRAAFVAPALSLPLRGSGAEAHTCLLRTPSQRRTPTPSIDGPFRRSSVRVAAAKGKGGARGGKKGGDAATEAPAKGGSKREEKRAYEELRGALARVGAGKWVDCGKAEREEVEKFASALEDLNSIDSPTRSSKLWGSWRLLYTDSPPMIKNKGVTGLGGIPLVGFEDLTQTLNSNGTAVTEEVLRMPPFGTRVTSYLRGNFTAAGPQVFEQTYVDVKLGSVFDSSASKVGSEVFFSKAVLAITYLSEELRVCRSPSEAIFIFERIYSGGGDI